MLKTIDKNSDGKLECETQLKLLSEEDIKNCITVFERDPSHCVDLEFCLIDFKNVESLLERREKCLKKAFIKTYMKHFRGSRPGGKKVFLDLDRNSDDVVEKDEINLNMDKVI